MHIEPPTTTAVRRVRASRAAIVAVAALACAALISACGSSSSTSSTATTTLNTTRVAKSIEESILKERHISAAVVCPSAVPQEKGKTFECVATSRSTKSPFVVSKTPFVVTIESNAGFVTYVGK